MFLLYRGFVLLVLFGVGMKMVLFSGGIYLMYADDVAFEFI